MRRRFAPLGFAWLFVFLVLSRTGNAQPGIDTRWWISAPSIAEGEPVRVIFEGPPPADAMVSVRSGKRILSVTAADSAISLPPLPPGRISITVSTPDETTEKTVIVHGEPMPDPTPTRIWLPAAAGRPRRQVNVVEGQVTVDGHTLPVAGVIAVTSIDWNADGHADLVLLDPESTRVAFGSAGPDFPTIENVGQGWASGAEVLSLTVAENGASGLLDFVAVTPGGPVTVPNLGHAASRRALSERPALLRAAASEPPQRSATIWGNTQAGNIYTIAGTSEPGFSGDGGLALAAKLLLPSALLIDPSGNVLFSDTGNRRVRRINAASRTIESIAGGGGLYIDNVTATSSALGVPRGIALDSAGNLYIADPGDSKVRKVDLGTLQITTVAGNGNASSGPDGGQATATPLNGPFSVAVAAGHLYFTESMAARVRRVNLTSGIIATVAGTGVPGFGGDNGPAAAAQIDGPTGIAADTAGNIYFADSNNRRIRRIDAATGIITTVAGTGATGVGGNGVAATSTPAAPGLGLLVTSGGDIYFAEDANHRIRRISGGIVTTVAGTGTQGLAGDNGAALAAQLDSPGGVALDVPGNLYIADTGSRRIRFVDRTSASVSFAAPAAFLAHNPASASIAITTNPAGAAWSAASDAPWLTLPVSAGNGAATLGYSASANPSVHGRTATITVNGYYSFTVTQAGAPASLSESVRMTGAAAGTGTLNLTVPAGVNWTAASTAPWLTVSPASGTGAATLTYSFSANAAAGPRAATLLIAGRRFALTQLGTNGRYSPVGTVPYGYVTSVTSRPTIGDLATDSNGNVFFEASLLRRVDYTSGNVETIAGAPSLYATQFVIDSRGMFYIADIGNDVIRRYDPATGVVSTVAGNGIRRSSGDGGPAIAAEVAFPTAISVDALGNLYFVEMFECRLRQIHAVTGIIRTVAGGVCGFAGDSGLALQGRFDYLSNSTVDANGDVYLADERNVRIRKVSLSTGVLTTFAGNGNAGSTGDGGLATAAAIDVPSAVAFAPDGALLLRESGRIRRIAPGTNLISTLGGNGNSVDLTGDGGPFTAALTGGTGPLTTDPFGNIYFGQTGPGLSNLRFVSYFTPQLTLAATAAAVPAAAGSGSVGIVQVPDGAAWTATSSASWLTTSATAQGASVSFSYLANPGIPRSATLTIAGRTFTVNQAAGTMPSILSGTPTNPVGSPRTFSFLAQDPDGRNDIARISFAFAPSTGAWQNACSGYWDRATNSLFLYADDGSTVTGPVALSAPGALQNSQCSLNAAASSVPSGAGTDIALNLSVSLRGAFATRVQKVFAAARDNSANDSGWTQTGLWSPASINRPPFLLSLVPQDIERSLRRFAITVRDPDGYANIARIAVNIGSASPPVTGSCYSTYELASGLLTLYANGVNDPIGTMPLNVPQSLNSEYCGLSGLSSVSFASNGTDMTLDVLYSIFLLGPISHKVFISVRDLDGNDSGWIEAGAWNPLSTPVAPFVASVSPASIAARSHTLGILANDPNGASNIQRIEFIVGSTASLQNSCAGHFEEATKTFVLYDDTGNPGSGANSQCTLGATAPPAYYAGGNALAIDLPLELKSPYGDSARPIFVRVRDDEGNQSPWFQSGIWTPPQTGPGLNGTAPISGAGASKSFVFTIDHPEGFGQLDVVNVLINRALDGRRACYVAYSQPLRVLYLVGDDGPPALSAGLTLGASGSVQNQQCRINSAGSSATGSGNRLTLTLNVTFLTPLGGNNVIYLAARDQSARNSGWRTSGVHQVPFSRTYPDAISVSPSAGTGATQLFELTFDDASSALNLQTAWMLVNTAVDGRQACYFAYYRPGNQLYLIPDNGDGNQATSIPLTAPNVIENSQCRIDAAGASFSVSGSRLTLRIPVQFKPAFAGPKGIWSAVATTNNAQVSPWQSLGAWNIP